MEDEFGYFGIGLEDAVLYNEQFHKDHLRNTHAEIDTFYDCYDLLSLA